MHSFGSAMLIIMAAVAVLQVSGSRLWFPRDGRANGGISNINSGVGLAELVEAKREGMTVFPRVGRAPRPYPNLLLDKDLYLAEEFEDLEAYENGSSQKSRTDGNLLH